MGVKKIEFANFMNKSSIHYPFLQTKTLSIKVETIESWNE
jgi:hypothetical protein